MLGVLKLIHSIKSGVEAVDDAKAGSNPTAIQHFSTRVDERNNAGRRVML